MIKLREILLEILNLSEGSLDDIKQYYKNIPEDIMFLIASKDPTAIVKNDSVVKVGKYTKSIFNLYLKDTVNFDSDEIDNLYAELKSTKKPINLTSFKTFNDLKDFLTGNSVDTENPIIYEDSEYYIREINSKRGACEFGKETGWCTARPNGTYYRDIYGKTDGELWIIFNKNNTPHSQLFLSKNGNIMWNYPDDSILIIINDEYETIKKLINYHTNINKLSKNVFNFINTHLLKNKLTNYSNDNFLKDFLRNKFFNENKIIYSNTELDLHIQEITTTDGAAIATDFLSNGAFSGELIRAGYSYIIYDRNLDSMIDLESLSDIYAYIDSSNPSITFKNGSYTKYIDIDDSPCIFPTLGKETQKFIIEEICNYSFTQEFYNLWNLYEKFEKNIDFHKNDKIHNQYRVLDNLKYISSIREYLLKENGKKYTALSNGDMTELFDTQLSSKIDISNMNLNNIPEFPWSEELELVYVDTFDCSNNNLSSLKELNVGIHINKNLIANNNLINSDRNNYWITKNLNVNLENNNISTFNHSYSTGISLNIVNNPLTILNKNGIYSRLTIDSDTINNLTSWPTNIDRLIIQDYKKILTMSQLQNTLAEVFKHTEIYHVYISTKNIAGIEIYSNNTWKEITAPEFTYLKSQHSLTNKV